MVVRAVIGVVLAAAVLATAASLAVAPNRAGAPSVVPRPIDAQPMVVREVVSGDTLLLVNASPGAYVQGWGLVTARLLDIDAPDLANTDVADECFAAEAQERLRVLLPEGSIAWVATGERPRDDVGRWSMRVWTPDGVLVSYALAIDGFARSLPTPPGATDSPAIARAVEEAFLRGAGLWTACSPSRAAN